MRPPDPNPSIRVLLTPEERWVRAGAAARARRRRIFARRHVPIPEASMLDDIPTAVAYKDLLPAERERRAKMATPEEMRLLYPELHAFRQAMKPRTEAGARVYRALWVFLLAAGLILAISGVVTACTDPNLHDAGGPLFAGTFLVFASFQIRRGTLRLG